MKSSTVENHLKDIFSQSVIYGFGSLIPRFLGFFLIPIYTRVLTPADYGILAIANVTSSVLINIYQLGQNGPLRRFYYDFRSDTKRKKYIGTIWIFEFLAALAFSLILTFFGKPLFGLIFKDVPFYPYLLIVVWIAFFSTFDFFPNVLLRMEKKTLFYSLLSISRFLVDTILIIFFVVILRKGVLGSLNATLIGGILFFAFYIYWIRNKMKFAFLREKLKESLQFGLPLVPHSISAWALTFIDRVMLERMTNLTQVGLYSIGYNMGFIISIVVNSINLAWSPFFIETVKKEGKKAPKIFSPLITYYFIFTCLVALALSVFSRDIVIIMTQPKYFEAYKIIPIIAFSYLFQGMYFMAISGLFQEKKTGKIASATTLTAVFNILLNFALIPRYGMLGAAWATLVSYFIFFFVAYILSLKIYPINFEWIKLTKVFVLSIILVIVGLYINTFSLSLWITIIIKIVLIVVYLVGINLLGLVRVKQVMNFLGSYKSQSIK